jgi:hypothetical protein
MNQHARVHRLLLFSASATSDADVATPSDSEAGRGGAAREWRTPWGFRLVSFAPFVTAAFNVIAAPTYFGGMTASPPELFGHPLGAWLYLWFLTLSALGAAIVWQARSRRVVYAAFLACTLPATFGLLFIPALVLYMQNVAV